MSWLQVYSSGGQREIRGRELPGVIGEKDSLLDLQQLDEEGKKVSLIDTVKWPAGKLAVQKILGFFLLL
jgi:phage protein U